MKYRLLGSSGLRVSEASLGTMTFGDERGWGSPKAEAQKVYETYREAGGNFIDTANFCRKSRLRSRIQTRVRPAPTSRTVPGSRMAYAPSRFPSRRRRFRYAPSPAEARKSIRRMSSALSVKPVLAPLAAMFAGLADRVTGLRPSRQRALTSPFQTDRATWPLALFQKF